MQGTLAELSSLNIFFSILYDDIEDKHWHNMITSFMKGHRFELWKQPLYRVGILVCVCVCSYVQLEHCCYNCVCSSERNVFLGVYPNYGRDMGELSDFDG